MQVQGTNGSWVTLSSGTSAADGTSSLPAPTWWAARQELRVYAPATALDEAATSATTGSISPTRRYTPPPGRQFSYLLGHRSAGTRARSSTTR